MIFQMKLNTKFWKRGHSSFKWLSGQAAKYNLSDNKIIISKLLSICQLFLIMPLRLWYSVTNNGLSSELFVQLSFNLHTFEQALLSTTMILASMSDFEVDSVWSPPYVLKHSKTVALSYTILNIWDAYKHWHIHIFTHNIWTVYW